ncbi:PREDICTED: uncharacterized protein LOC105361116 [Ceratosolen solmsi marchali]|uniref:Uncharacterized protein LOC105361116 n=1 Tax=Ceratosolen solmsi marchali TaxID=326594 RepID=A0AAJ6YEE7_9HYME|nr:PREDICTED: uncharacterized protein LOC105361116 [Ceratosolen solmsi marchali]
MTSKHSWPTFSSELLNDLNYEYDIENSNNDKKTNGCKIKGNSYDEHNDKYMNITCISMKLNKFQTFDCQRIKADIYSNYYKIWPKCKDQNTNTTQTLTHERQSDKAIQCSKSNEFLQISPDIKFASRSSLVINMDPKNVKYRQYHQQHRCSEHISKRKFITSVVPSLEYIANYKPNFYDENKQNFLNLRSFSTSATFGFQKRILKTRRVADNVDNTLEDKDNVRIENDLISFRHNNRSKMTKKLRSRNLEKSDILMVKKILLDDYITEVREIIHPEGSKMEGSQETKILENVKKRMDMDPVEVKFSASMQEFMCPTLSSRSSNCCSFIPYSDDCDKNVFLGKSNPFFDKNLKIVCELKKVKKNHPCNLEVKSSLSTDLGVQVDFSHLYNDWQSLNDLNVNTSQDEIAKLSSRSYSDDVLYQRVENAVRIFTEKLILCERRIGDRSKIQKRQQDERWVDHEPSISFSDILATDHSANNTCIYPSNACCTSEDEQISGISTSSFISLTDSEILPAFKMSILK